MNKIHKINDNTFVISCSGVWLPGSFDSEETANKAFEFPEEDILNLQNEKNKTTCVINMEDLNKLKHD